QRIAEPAVVDGVLRLEAHGFAERGDGAIVIVFAVTQELAKGAVNLGPVRLGADQRAEGGLRVGQLAVADEGPGAVETGKSVIPACLASILLDQLRPPLRRPCRLVPILGDV